MTEFNNNPEIMEALKEAYEWGYSDGQSDGREGHGDKSGRDECAYTLAEQVIGNRTEIVGWLYEYDYRCWSSVGKYPFSRITIERWERGSTILDRYGLGHKINGGYTRNMTITPLIKGF